MELTKYKPLIEAFLNWYNQHQSDENPYKDQLTHDYLSKLDKESFIDFFYNFYADGGKIQSGGHRKKNRFRDTLINHYDEFRAYLLEPFNQDFDVIKWLEQRKRFDQWGEGVSSIYLNRVKPDIYPITNAKVIDCLKLLGFTIQTVYPQRYKDVLNAQKLLMAEFPELKNFHVTDKLNHFVVAEPEGQSLIRELNPDGILRVESDDPIRNLIESYKQRQKNQGLKDELYKWQAVKYFQDNWNPDDENFGTMFENAISRQVNLIDHRPLPDIKTLCREFPNQFKEIILLLYDETTNLNDRIKNLQNQVTSLFKENGKKENASQDERTISLYLFFRYPDKYIHYKESYYIRIARLLGLKTLSAGEKYTHFQQVANDFKHNYLLKDDELIENYQENLPEDVYQDTQYNLLTQDTLYFIENQIKEESSRNYWLFQGNPEKFDFKTGFEKNLIDSWTVTAHKEKIKIGDKAILWLTGKSAGCYGLAEITGAPARRKPSRDDSLWKEENKSDWNTGIRIIHNLYEKPILQSEIEMDPDFDKFPAGNQGTNFAATKLQYETLEAIANPISEDLERILSTFSRQDLADYITVMVSTISHFGLKPSDERIIYSVQSGRLNFTVGQRYAFTCHKNNQKGKFGFISDTKLEDTAGQFSGPPVAYYNHHNNLDFWHQHKDSYFNGVANELSRTSRSSYRGKTNKKFERYLFDQLNRQMIKPEFQINIHPKNQILYGPPGTGKTYSTINHSIAIVENKPLAEVEKTDRNWLRKRFDEYVESGRIVFTTFHQSMNYEDFVEGIKPVEPEKEGDPVIYRTEYGVFRKLCIEAAFSYGRLRESKDTEDVLDFSLAYDQFVEKLEERLTDSRMVTLETKAGGTVLVDGISPQGNIIIKHHNGQRTYTISKTRLTKLQASIKNLDEVSNINDHFRTIIGGSNSSAYWSVLNAIRKETIQKKDQPENRKYTDEEKQGVVKSLVKADYINKNAEPYVLIIDEINRGNVSQIFGELITLIENDKRLGENEAIEVTLPYSREKFGVPSNLYIIGTMNTADRSVEALDTALRRRFSFVEMAPRYDLEKLGFKVYDEFTLRDILKKINHRIDKLIDKDHLIGHSYFLQVNSLEALQTVFENNILPLLQEYFYGDPGKIALVLGTGFFEMFYSDRKTDVLAKVDWYDHREDLEERVVVKIKNPGNMTSEEFIEALMTMMN